MILTDLELTEIEKYTENYNFCKNLRNKTVLITGSKGILGSGIVKWILYLNKKVNLNCHIIASSRTTEKPDYIECDDDIKYCQFGLENKFAYKVDFIIHSAAPTSNKYFMSNPVQTLEVILDGTKNMLELAKCQNAKMIYISSEEVYGTIKSEIAVDESFIGSIDSLNVRNSYPLGKKIAELLCKSYSTQYSLDVKIVRPTVILGLWQPYDSVKVECEILRCILENKNLIMKSDGSTKKSVIYSLDCIAAIFMVLFYGVSGEAYNITNPETYTTVKDRASTAFKKYNPNVNIEFMINTPPYFKWIFAKARIVRKY